MLKKIGLALVVIIALLFAYAGMQSPDYKISRSITINAPAEKIFPYLSNSKLAESWGPWLDIDPGTKMTYSGPEAGVGNKASWTGGKQLGTGSATITEMVPNQRVSMTLEYTEPMAMQQFSVYSIEAQGSQSVVSWTVTGQNNIVGRVMCLFMNMDKQVGGMFEKGLIKLKNLVEHP